MMVPFFNSMVTVSEASLIKNLTSFIIFATSSLRYKDKWFLVGVNRAQEANGGAGGKERTGQSDRRHNKPKFPNSQKISRGKLSSSNTRNLSLNLVNWGGEGELQKIDFNLFSLPIPVPGSSVGRYKKRKENCSLSDIMMKRVRTAMRSYMCCISVFCVPFMYFLLLCWTLFVFEGLMFIRCTCIRCKHLTIFLTSKIGTRTCLSFI